MMNKEQMVGLARHLLPFLGGIAVAKGYLSHEQADSMTNGILEVIGPALTLIGAAWSVHSKTDKAIAEKAAELPRVQQLQVDPSLAEELRNNPFVVVGPISGGEK